MSRTINSALLLGSNLVRNARTKEAVIRSLSTTQLSHRWSSPSLCAATQLINLQANHGRPRHAISHITNFSTAAMMPQTNDDQQSSSSTNSSTKQQRPKRTRRSLDPLLITPAAAARIHFLISQHNLNNPGSPEGPAVGIRLGTKKRGCNGLSYTLNYAYENHLENHPRDEAMTINLSSPDMEGNGLKVFVEPMALMNVIGTEMDFLDTVMTSEFTFTNPNSKGECGFDLNMEAVSLEAGYETHVTKANVASCTSTRGSAVCAAAVVAAAASLVTAYISTVRTGTIQLVQP